MEIEVAYLTNHSGSKYSGGNGKYSLSLKASCGCESETPQATELDSIDFSGSPPEGWE